ncbi:STAS domain-containing protein [Baekduia soli]|uniref:STAS domain-containing protein n=1 Tax=Baekduia soli TaxID=496014 RepID=UPI002AA29FA8|nr:STAS domain-containing protein [Baekduia soli]
MSTPVLRDMLDALAGKGRTVMVNVREVTFMDSTGLNLLIRSKQHAEQDGWSLRVAREVSPQVARLFELTAISEYLLSE